MESMIKDSNKKRRRKSWEWIALPLKDIQLHSYCILGSLPEAQLVPISAEWDKADNPLSCDT